MRNRFFKSVISVVLILAVLITSDALIWSAFAAESHVVGIDNHVMTTSAEPGSTKYIIRFLKHKDNNDGFNQIRLPSELTLNGGKSLVPTDSAEEGSAYIFLDANESIAFNRTPAFIDFIRDKNIDGFTVEYVPNELNMHETTLLYSKVTQECMFGEYKEVPNPFTGQTVNVWRSWLSDNTDPFDTHTFELNKFDSTTMTEVTVEQEWRDRGTDERPAVGDVKIDLLQNGEAYLNYNDATLNQSNEYVYTLENPADGERTYKAYMTAEQSSSTTYKYTFTVPEFDPDGTAYTYTSKYSDKPEGSADNQYPVDFENEYKQGEHPDADPNKYLAIGLTDFTFLLNWKDAAVPEARPVIDLDFIRTNFKLYDQSGKAIDFAPETIPEGEELSDYFTINENAGVTTITVKRLEDLTADGTANEYYVVLNYNDSKINVSQNQGVDQNDYYAVKSSNTGIHGSEFDKTYANGEFEMMLTGKMDFTGTINWEDAAESETRRQDTEAASLTLWRYLEKDALNYLDYSAIVTSGENPQIINGDTNNLTVRFTNLDKYDNAGNRYHYYGVENVTVEKNNGGIVTLLPYAVEYTQEGQSGTTVTQKLENGGTVTNKLSDKVEFSVSAEWIAAARQGGTASATYQLQRRIVGEEDWSNVLDEDGNTMERTLTFDELHMKREGDETCIFDEVDLYDEHGYLYEYRVVQTSVTRSDEMPGDNPHQTNTSNVQIPSDGETVEITVNDKYHVIPSVNGTDFHFQYNIEGDTKVNITKQWLDLNRQPITTVDDLDSDGKPTYKAQFTVQNYNNALLRYVDYFRISDYNEGETFFEPYIQNGYLVRDEQDSNILYFNSDKATFRSSDGKNWTVTGIEVPKYDQDGREIAYRPVEIYSQHPDNMDFYSRYSWNVTTENLLTTYEYVATNYQTTPGDEYAEIAINKEWVDDGEQEYRKPIVIEADKEVYHKYESGNWTDYTPTAQAQELNQANVWEDRLAITYRYKRDAQGNFILDSNGNRIPDNDLIYQYNSSDFREKPAGLSAGDTEQYYWDKTEIARGLTDETQWIQQLLTGDYWSSGGTVIDRQGQLTNGNSVDMTNQNGIGFRDFAGIYKSKSIDGNPQHCHYYAVRQVYDRSGVNGAYATLRFINTRIGVISYEVKFDWNVGDALTRQDNPINKVTLRITGNGLPKGGLVQEITPQNLIPVGDGTYAYYILNLPKYDEAGKLIEYKIAEIKIGDSTVNENGEVSVGSDNCIITVSDETIIEGEEAKTDDLHSIKITNTFEDETGITVHKRWADNKNAENTRTDLFLKLHRKSTNPEATEEHSSQEYEWKQSALDSDNEWSYTFSGLEKYDAQGYPYTYYVTEQEPDRLPGYKQTYLCGAPYKLDDRGKPIQVKDEHGDPVTDEHGDPVYEKNDKVYLDTSAQDFRTDVAYDGGIITNRLYGELTINGEKLWKNVSLLLQKNHYPIAHVSLYRTVQNSDISQHVLDLLESEHPLTAEEIAAGKVLIADTYVMNGANSFIFTDATDRAKHIGFVIPDESGSGHVNQDGEWIPDPQKLENGNIVLPKYDNAGRAIEYTLEEESLNGYLSKIEKGSTKLINDFQGGIRLKFDVTKQWEGMEGRRVYPTITFTLFQVFRINNGTEQNPDYSYILMNHFDRVVPTPESGQNEIKVTFGDNSHPEEANYLRYYAPTGEPYIYFVAETLSNYGGDRRIFIDAEHAGYISEYLAQNYSSDKSQVVTLDGNVGKALGFTSTVEQTFADPADIVRERIVNEPEPETEPAADPETPDEAEPATAPTTPSIEERVREALNNKDGEPVQLEGAVKNTYVPDDANFHGQIDIAKDWDNDTLHEGDQADFSKVRSYSFTLSRKTEKIDAQTLFKVITKDSLSAASPGYVVSNELTIPVPEFQDLAEGMVVIRKDGETNDFTPSMTLPNGERFGTPPEQGQIPKYFVGILRKDNKDVTVVVQVGEENESDEIELTYVNKAHISGFAIYGHDAMKYTYTVTEGEKSGYTREVSSGSSQLSDDDNNVPKIDLRNKINVFDLTFHKAFAKEYDDNGTHVIEPLKTAEYDQFFNDSYFEQLTFNLKRSSVSGNAEDVISVTGRNILDAIDNGTNDAKKDSSGTGGYSYTIYDLPITDVLGNLYTYWIEEDDGAQTGSDPKVYTRYSDSEFVRADNPVLGALGYSNINLTGDENGTTKDTYVQNVFKAKKIAINKYWLDNNNEDYLRPETLEVTVYEKDANDHIDTVRINMELDKDSGWHMEPALARYYFNGTTPENLQYSISEIIDESYLRIDKPGVYGGGQRTGYLNLPGTEGKIYDNGWTDYPASEPTADPDTYYVYFKNNDNWLTVNACVWKNGGEMKWSGKAMEHVRDDIYRIEVPSDMSYVVFNNSGESTDALTVPAAGIYKYGTGWEAFDETGLGTAPAGNYYIYFKNTGSWNRVNAYIYDDSGYGRTSWPGNVMEFVRTENDGDIYRINIKNEQAGTAKIIFNNIVDNPDDTVSYTVPGYIDGVYVPVSDFLSFKDIPVEGSGDTVYELNLTNYKLPQKGTITFDKKFDPVDESVKELTRPEKLYFKLIGENGYALTISDYSTKRIEVMVGDKYVKPSAAGVITVPRNDDYTYPRVNVTNLPAGSNGDGTVQSNGTAENYTVKSYQFVECSEDGSELPESFPYTPSQAEAIAPHAYYYQGFHGGASITNTLKSETHTVQKKWSDDANNGIPNYYQTRPDEFIVKLERTTDPASAETRTWVTVAEDIKLETDMDSLENYHTYSETPAKTATLTINSAKPLYNNGWKIYSDSTAEDGKKYIYYKNNRNWKTVNAYMFRDRTGMTKMFGTNDVFRVEVPEDMQYITFSGGSLSTETLSIPGAGKIYDPQSGWSDYQNATQPAEGKIYVYFKDSGDWRDLEYPEKIYALAWKDGEGMSWPGTKMTCIDETQNIWRAEVPDGMTHVIFNNKSVFNSLPQYDMEGNRYYYRVVETYIGPKDAKHEANKVFHDASGEHDASNVYYIDYDYSQDNTTQIDNSLIRKTEYQNFYAQKVWDDNTNQDGKRTPVTVVFTQSIEVNGEKIVKFSTTETLSEENGWRYEWTNYPLNDEDGNLYSYEVAEQSVPGYDPSNVHIYSTAEGGEQYGKNSYEKERFTNTHAQEYKSLSVNKEWLNEQTASDKNLRPESIEFILCCQYTAYKYVSVDPETGVQAELSTDEEKLAAKNAGTLQLVEDGAKSYDGPVNYDGQQAVQLLNYYPDVTKTGDDTHYTITLQPNDKTDDDQWRNGVTFENLPVYINTCGDARWDGQEYAIKYYVKEVIPDQTNNPYDYGVTCNNTPPYQNQQNIGCSPETTLLDGTTAADKTVTAANKLKSRTIKVNKIWQDNGYGDSLHYDIDFTLTCSGASGYSYTETKTLDKDAKDTNDTPIRFVEFDNLPVYDKDGTLLSYTVTETVNGGTGATANHMHGYVQSTPDPTLENGIITAYTITNTLPVTRIKADKVWNDNNNQDGKRPEQLNFTLSRTAESQTADVNTLHDTSASHENDSDLWNVDFNVQPQYNPNNAPYSYSITEEAEGDRTLSAREYTRYVETSTDKNNYVINDNDTDTDVITTQTVEGITEKTFHFKNRYTPKDDSLTIKKSWADTVGGTDYSPWTRPASVTVSLYAKYNGTTVNLANASENDPVKALFPANYEFTRTIASNESWQKIYGNLPCKVNPTGTDVFNGQSFEITYYVRETELNGYTTAYSTDDAHLTAQNDEITVTNTLKTKNVRVKKVWADKNYSGTESQHYAVNLTLTNTNTGVTFGSTYTATATISATTEAETATVDFLVPQYVYNGDEATYTVVENASDRKYGYVTSYSDNHSFKATEAADNEVITVTNTLPLTEITVNKLWDDDSNAYNLRPDSITVTLERRPVTNNGAAWADDNTGWTRYDAVTMRASGERNSWTYTYDKLPKFDVNNIEYGYRVTEAKVNAYDTYYQTESGYDTPVVTKQDTHADSDSQISFGVKNTLITEPIRLTKVWDNSGYQGSDLRYDPVTFTVSKPAAMTDFSFTALDVEMQGNDSWTTTREVPVYDMSGNPIQYTVTEDTSDLHYGYAQYGDVAVTKTGSHGSDEDYYNSYTITNKLPLTDVTAVKHWAGDLELYPNADATVKVNLTRKSTTDSGSGFNVEKQINYSNGTGDSVTYDHLLAKDYNNNPYTYTVTEQLVRGYTTTYDKQDVSPTDTGANRTVTVTNTPLTYNADLFKYDVTDLEKHGADSRFVFKVLPGAEFELYRERGGYQDKLFYATGGDGIYTVCDQNAQGATSTLVTGESGRLVIAGLEPNTYYLKETKAPEGYQLNTNKFYFFVSVSEQNEISISYDSKPAELTNEGLMLDGSPFTANAARVKLTEFIPSYTHGIPNEENMSRLTLTKVDANNTATKLPNATYYLLRLYNFKYRKPGAAGSTEQEYLTNALATLGADYSDTSPLWTYWEKIAVRSTDSNGQITFEGHMFGTYVFYEVKAPTGFERDYTYNATTAETETNKNVLGPIYLDYHNAQHETETHSLTHLEPRSKAHINVLKTDENGNPLKDAEFKLYKDGDTPVLLTTFKTGYDGMNPTEFEIDTSSYAWGQKFFLIEETPPIGYDADNVPVQNKIEFTLTPELAEEVVHIVRANDVRLKGKVDLTKVSSSQTTTVSAGDPLGGAEFELYAKDGTKLSLYPHTTNTNTYRVVSATDITAAGFDPNTTVTTLTTSAAGAELGKLHIEGLDWGDYYLLETQAPTGYKIPSGEDAKVYFSVGRTNSGDTAQQLTMKNDPDTAALNIIKTIDKKNVSAWGDPVFIFKVKQTAGYDYDTESFVALAANKQRTLTKSITISDGLSGTTGKFDVEPGTYVITEMRVARYSASSNAVIRENSSDKVLGTSVTKTTATLSVKPGGDAEITFSNQLKTYEKLSHTDKKTNSFNGFKALEVHDKDGLILSLDVDGVNYTVTVPKSDLNPQLIRSDGTKTAITSDFSKLAVTKKAADTEFTLIDNGASITIKGRREDLAGSSYKLTATYDGKFTDEFELRIPPVQLFDKTEKTVEFRNDTLNRSHYMDGANQTNVYSLMFILKAVGSTTVVNQILHNGVATGKFNEQAFPAPVIESDYSDKWEFDKWSYSYDNAGTPVTGTASSAELIDVIKNAPDNAKITVTAVLKEKSS